MREAVLHSAMLVSSMLHSGKGREIYLNGVQDGVAGLMLDLCQLKLYLPVAGCVADAVVKG